MHTGSLARFFVVWLVRSLLSTLPLLRLRVLFAGDSASSKVICFRSRVARGSSAAPLNLIVL